MSSLDEPETQNNPGKSILNPNRDNSAPVLREVLEPELPGLLISFDISAQMLVALAVGGIPMRTLQ